MPEEVKEQFNTDDLDELERDLEDFDLAENKITYEIWLLGNAEDGTAVDFEYLLDGEYSDLKEAQCCFNYFSELENIKNLAGLTIPEEIKYLYLRLETVELDEDGEFVCTELYDEKEFIL